MKNISTRTKNISTCLQQVNRQPFFTKRNGAKAATKPFFQPKAPIQKVTKEEEETQTIQKKENNTGLPDNLKAGVENLSGYSMDDVKVHYNSSKPAQLNAHAYAQGTDIHIAPGQERHLPHEAWHVVQQKQGRVKATRQMKQRVGVTEEVGLLERRAGFVGVNANSVFQLNARDRRKKRQAEKKEVHGRKKRFKQMLLSSEDPMILAYELRREYRSNDLALANLKNAWMDAFHKPFRALALEEHTENIGSRLRLFNEERTNESSPAGEFDDSEGDIRNDALRDDPELENSKLFPGFSDWAAVYDYGIPLRMPEEQANAREYLERKYGAVPENWTSYVEGQGGVPKGAAGSTKFENLYHQRAVIMMENYRPAWKRFFASDAFFSQWIRATNSNDPNKSLEALPTEFPKFFYRNHIDNPVTLEKTNQVLGEAESKKIFFGSKDWKVVKDAPNVKSTFNILSEYNRINTLRNAQQFRIESLLIYGDANLRSLKFTIVPK